MLPAAQNIYRAISKIKFSQQVLAVLKPEFELEKKIESAQNGYKFDSLNFDYFIRLENIKYAYPSRLDEPVLENFSLKIKNFQTDYHASPSHYKACLEKLALLKESDVA